MTATWGWSADDTAEVFGRARVVAERAGDAESLHTFFGLHNAAFTRAEHGPALSLAYQLLEIAHGQHNRSALAIAHYAQALPRHYLGDLAGAREHFLRAIEHHRQEEFCGTPLCRCLSHIRLAHYWGGQRMAPGLS